MKVEKEKEKEEKKSEVAGFNIQFEFPDLRKLLKLTAPVRSTIKSQRPFFAMKMDYDFSHMEIRAFIKETNQVIQTGVPLEEISYFSLKKDLHTIQIRIIYEGG